MNGNILLILEKTVEYCDMFYLYFNFRTAHNKIVRHNGR